MNLAVRDYNMALADVKKDRERCGGEKKSEGERKKTREKYVVVELVLKGSGVQGPGLGVQGPGLSKGLGFRPG